MTRFLAVTVALCTCLAIPAAAQPVIDGSAADVLYGDALVVQDTQTGFGDSDLGRPDIANGSELDGAYATIYGGTLCLVLAGNFETNGNKLEIFFDTRPGGQNQLLGVENPDIDFGALQRMGYLDAENPGLKFDDGFEADFYVTANAFGDPTVIYVAYAELYVDEFNPGVGYYLGEGQTTCETSGGALTGGDPAAPFAVLCTLDNSNVDGVTGGFGIDDGSGVLTGFELAIPLSAIGDPAGDFQICTFINGQQHDFVSNQVLAGIFALVADNLGEPRQVDFSAIFFDQFFTVPISSTPVGACCVGETCEVMTAADCAAAGGTYLGDNVDCDGNPCDAIAAGACCIDGVCSIQTEADCLAAGGEYLGDGTDCVGCPCPNVGACCLDTTCTVTTEADCLALDGEYLGDYTDCADDPCAVGACCLETGCVEVREEVCNDLLGRYLGDGVPCDPDPCAVGACCLGDLCFVVPVDDCTALYGTYLGDGTDCSENPCGTPEGLPTMDGAHDAVYGTGLAVQDTQTGFGDADQGLVDFANGSEHDAAYAYIIDDRLYLLLTGNLESNFNKLEVFFDTRPGGQNRLLGPGVNPDVDFDALGRMGDDGSGNGLTFDAVFEADFYFTATGGNDPYELYANFAELYVDAENPGAGYFLGRGYAADRTDGGLLDPVAGSDNPFPILATIDNSNIEGVVFGFATIGPDENPADVLTGMEVAIPLSALGDPTEDFLICTFINGMGHDFLSNQVLGPIAAFGGDNLGEPREVNFEDIPGEQLFLVSLVSDPCAGQLKADSNCDGHVDGFDIDPFVLALVDPAGWEALYGGLCDYLCVNDVNEDGSVDGFDIDAFVDALVGS